MTFEETFFGPGNRLRWDAIQSGAIAQDVRDRLGPFLDEVQLNSSVLTLPRVLDNGTVEWYVLCSSPRDARVARDELLAFVGRTYSAFDGRPARLDPTDRIDAAVLERYGKNVFKLHIPERELIDTARERLKLMVSLRKERPTRAPGQLRAVGRILRDFEYALLTGNDNQAALLVSQLKSEGHLSATNILFLEIRRHAASGHWDAVMALPELDAIVSMPRPKRVTEAIVQAVYETRLREYETGQRADEAFSQFKAEVYPRFQELYRSRATLKGASVDASFILAAAVTDPPRPGQVSEVLAGYLPQSPEREYLEALARLVPNRERGGQDALAIAKQAFAEAEIDEAFAFALQAPASFDRTALLLRSARDIGTLSAAQVALESADALDSQDRARLDRNASLTKVRESLEELRSRRVHELIVPVVTEALPSDWLSWLRRLADSQPWAGAVAAAEIGSREWDVRTLVNDPVALEQLTVLLLDVRTDWGTTALRDSLPYLLEFCLKAGIDRRLKSVYESLFLIIATDDQVSLSQVAALLKVIDVRLQLGVTADEYGDATRQLAAAMKAVNTPAIAPVALDAIEVLITSVCPAESARQTFVAEVAAIFQRWFRRVGHDEVALLQVLAGELGVPPAVQIETSAQGSGTENEWTGLRGRRVSIYSLQESALRRAALVIARVCPEARVDTHHDHVGSQALKVAANAADIFVLATAAAKHAATTFIEANRPKRLVTLYARGQGSSSLLQALREHLKSA